MATRSKRPKPTRRHKARSPYAYDPDLRVWSRPGYGGIAYSDGDAAEAGLLELLRLTQDPGTLSPELAGKITGWTTEAHLSAARSNLLRPFRFRPKQRILEVGAGCGALTRYLGETGGSVDALEGAPLRAACAAERCRDLDNVRVICDEYTQFAAAAPYDVVTLIGVLEYSRLFIRAPDPAAECLSRARSLLTRDGSLVVAIENQLGLKYFNGCNEDHLGVPFPGITDLYGANSAVTFGRRVLEAQLHAAGFDRIDWYFPFPDYKTPSIVVSERALRTPGFSVSDLLFGETSRDYSGNAHRCFDEANVWPVLERNGLLADFAPSFLAVASVGAANGLDSGPAWLARKFSTFRHRRFATATTFACRRDAKITVDKTLLDPAAAAADTGPALMLPLVHRLGPEPYIPGTLFARELSKALGRGHELAYLAGLLTPWIKVLLERAQLPPRARAATTPWSSLRLPGELLDCVPFNLIVDSNGDLRPIDTEFAVTGTVPLPWVVLRGLVHTATRCFGHRAFFDLTAEQLVRQMLPHLGLSDIEDWTPYLELEDNLIRSVLLPWPGRKERDIFRERLSLPVSPQLSYVDALNRSRSDLRRSANALSQLLDFLQRLQAAAPGVGADASALGVDVAALAAGVAPHDAARHDEKAVRASLVELVEAQRQLHALTRELATRDEEAARRLEDRDRSWRRLFAEAEARFHQREETIARALLDTEARFQAGETAAARREQGLHEALSQADRQLQLRGEEMAERNAAAAQRERDLHDALAQADRQLQLRGEEMAARDAAAAQRERDLHEVLARTDRQLQLRSEEMATRDAAAAQREQDLHEVLARAAQQAQAREDQLSANLAAVEAQRSAKEREAVDLVAQLRDRDDQLLARKAQLRVLEEHALTQTGRAATAEQRLAAIERAWPYRLLRPFMGAAALPPEQQGRILFRAARAAYKLLPASASTRRRLKDSFYERYGPLFKYVQNYQVWEAQRSTTRGPAAGSDSERMTPMSDETSPGAASEAAVKGISVVIPALGKLDMTRRCVEAVRESGHSGPLEIIVVDDGSAEPIAPGLADIAGVTVVRNDTNQGFIAACNRGAALAGEPYLLVLNNDTEVEPGALTEMVRTFEAVPEAGAVGCKLVFPDGRLQEAGARIKADGSAEMIGLWDEPNRGCYEFMREVGYCSGACLMVDRALFSSLGGFDAAFAPAYCEDSDLCYRIRRAGRKVIYQPRATVVHRLSTSMDDAGLDKHTVVALNQAKFLDRWQGTLRAEDAVRTIAFYLPQYHSIPENDEWWGQGFTEWTNVAKARPVFKGHAQPIEPGEFGYYDLRSSDIRKRQADLARTYGIHGFCYYHYWFGGKRLLYEPLDQMIASGEPDFPFCVCWANENWTRQWDGLDSDILIAQKHSPEDDLQFIESLLPAFRDRRYIRVDGRPLLVVYRPSLLPDARATAQRWRQYCREQGVGDLYLVMVQSFYHLDSTGPAAFGFDAAVEFPPHSLAIEARKQPRGLNGQRFEGKAYDYAQTADNFLRREMPPYKLFRTVMPRWDNTPRRGHHANIFTGATPAAFEAWFARAVEYTKRMYVDDERLVFINAWNEWGEGNFLEPDLQNGSAFLEATRRVLQRSNQP